MVTQPEENCDSAGFTALPARLTLACPSSNISITGLGLLDARKRPTGRSGEELILRSREPLQYVADPIVSRRARPQAGIPERDAGVAYQAAPFGTFDGASAKELAKVCFAQPEEPFQSWEVERFVLRRERRLGVVFLWRGKTSWLELRYRHHRGAPVPRANVLADVAAENRVSHRLAELLRDSAPQFDRQVGNALSGIHDVGLDESLRRAGVKATPAAPAQIRRRQFVRPERRFEIESGENDAEKKVGAVRLVEQQRVFPQPTQTGIFCEHSLLDRSRSECSQN